MVAYSHTLVDESAVVIEVYDAAITELAVGGERRSLNFAGLAEAALVYVAFLENNIFRLCSTFGSCVQVVRILRVSFWIDYSRVFPGSVNEEELLKSD